MYKYLLKIVSSLCFLLFSIGLRAQTINGRILDTNNQSVSSASILLKDKSDLTVIKEFTFARKGVFSIVLKKKYTSLVVEVQVDGYTVPYQIIENPVKQNKYQLEFRIEPQQKVNLKEVVILAKKRPFEIVEDTIKYNVAAYRDGSERKIEEIIKKLPGIMVDPNSGKIKYKGKEIETVMLEGDNLFGYNYTTGTKNINVDMVDQVQAVDHYSENPLLKGIEQNDKVALNLTLKKGKIDFSGDGGYGNGSFDQGSTAHDANATLLGITKKFKSFGTVSYNNVGKNNSPFDYSGFNLNPEELREKDIYANTVIPETIYSSVLGDKRANVNNQWFGNFNSIFKIGKEWSIKTNGYYIKDRITQNQFLLNQFQINTQDFVTSDVTSSAKSPEQYRGDLELKYTISKTALIEYTTRIKEEDIVTPTTILRNTDALFKSNLRSRDQLFKQRVLWTNKLSETQVMQASLQQNSSCKPQVLDITPSLFNANSNVYTQESGFKKNYIEGVFRFLGKVKKNKYDFMVGAIFDENPFQSNLSSANNTVNNNDFVYTQKSLFQKGSYHFNIEKWRFSPSYTLRYLVQQRTNMPADELDYKRDLILEPSLAVSYRISSIAYFNATLGYKQTTNPESFLFENPILINNRISYSNTPSLALQKRQFYTINYSISDLFNQFELNAGFEYQKVKGNFFSNATITENTTIVNNFFLPEWKDDLSANLKVSKYVPFLESTLSLTSNFGYSSYKNIVNNSDLRNNKTYFFRNELFCKTAFDWVVNFESITIFNNSISKSQGQQQQFTNASFQQTFRALVSPIKSWKWIVSSDYFLPNTDNKKTDFLFLDSSFNYQQKQNKWRLGFEIKNVMNNKNFEQVQTNDFSTTIFRSNLLPRYFLVSFNLNF